MRLKLRSSCVQEQLHLFNRLPVSPLSDHQPTTKLVDFLRDSDMYRWRSSLQTLIFLFFHVLVTHQRLHFVITCMISHTYTYAGTSIFVKLLIDIRYMQRKSTTVYNRGEITYCLLCVRCRCSFSWRQSLLTLLPNLALKAPGLAGAEKRQSECSGPRRWGKARGGILSGDGGAGNAHSAASDDQEHKAWVRQRQGGKGGEAAEGRAPTLSHVTCPVAATQQPRSGRGRWIKTIPGNRSSVILVVWVTKWLASWQHGTTGWRRRRKVQG
jgi:hypothetical protein